MTSAEKIAELRRLLQAELANGRDPQLASLYGAWRMTRPFVRRPLERMLVDVDVENAEQLDAWLGLIAGAALELRSDDVDVDVDELRAGARELLERVFAGELEEPRR